MLWMPRYLLVMPTNYGVSGANQRMVIFSNLCSLMQRTRAQYKYAIRHCRKHEARMQADSVANSLANKHYGVKSPDQWLLTQPTRLRWAQLLALKT